MVMVMMMMTMTLTMTIFISPDYGITFLMRMRMVTAFVMAGLAQPV
jgi:hypothetical protein